MIKDQQVQRDAEGSIILAPLLENICNMGFFNFENHAVSYFSESSQMYVFAAKYPVPADVRIPAAELGSSNTI